MSNFEFAMFCIVISNVWAASSSPDKQKWVVAYQILAVLIFVYTVAFK